MSKKNLIFSTILLLAIVSVSYLSVSSVNTNSVVDKEQNNDNVAILVNPKSSGYAVSEKWNVTRPQRVYSVAVSADGKYMVIGNDRTGDSKYELCLKKVSNNQTIWTYDFDDDMYNVAISADGSYIVAGFGSQIGYEIFLFNNSIPVGNKYPIWKFDTGNDCYMVDISADGKYIVAGTENMGVLLFNNSIPVGAKKPHWHCDILTGNAGPESVAISADGEYIVVGRRPGSGSGVLFFNNSYHPGTDKLWEWNYTTTTVGGVNSVAISAKGEYVVAGCNKQDPGAELFVFNKSADDGNPEWSYDVGTNVDILSVAISEANGEYIAAGGNEIVNGGKLFFFNRSNYKDETMWEYYIDLTEISVAITGLGEYIVAGADGNDKGIYLFNKSADGVKYPEWSFKDGYDYDSVSISSWGNYIAAGGTYAAGTGKAHLFYHTRPIPRALGALLGDDDDDDDEEAIPFGNYYLVFAILAIVALIIIYKRKVILNKR